jgi:glycosyltransferase involved in cell wall biosynthesis
MQVKKMTTVNPDMDKFCKKEITLIIPVCNEENNIFPLFKEIAERLKLPHQALIIYDTDDDNTLLKQTEIEQRFSNAVFVKNKYGRGVINAFKTGFDLAQTEYVVPIMADLSDT